MNLIKKILKSDWLIISTIVFGVLAIDSDTTLSLENDIMVSGEVYVVQGSDAAKARYKITNDDGWTITDNGGVN